MYPLLPPLASSPPASACAIEVVDVFFFLLRRFRFKNPAFKTLATD
jgi:hypothetical protein